MTSTIRSCCIFERLALRAFTGPIRTESSLQICHNGSDLQQWRKRNYLTQVNVATLLGVSQTYLSLLEKGVRPSTPELTARMKVARRDNRPAAADLFRAQLSMLGYPGFTRVVDALPWLVRQYASQMDFRWLVRQAKLQDLQNRLGFVLQVAGLQGDLTGPQETWGAVGELERARLLQEATLCWDACPPQPANGCGEPDALGPALERFDQTAT